MFLTPLRQAVTFLLQTAFNSDFHNLRLANFLLQTVAAVVVPRLSSATGLKDFESYKRYKNKIKDNNEKICSRLSDTVSLKINFTTFSHHGDHPPALVLTEKIHKEIKFIVT